MKTTLLFFFLLGLFTTSCTKYITSPARVVGVMESPDNLGECEVLVAYAAKSGRIKEAWISAPCNEYLVADTLIHHSKSEIQVVRTEDKE